MADVCKQLIVKSNPLIEAKYDLTVNEQRLVLATISQVRRDSQVTDQYTYSVTASTWSEMTGANINGVYEELAAAAHRLLDRKVVLYEEPNSGQRKPVKLVTHWVQSVRYIQEEGKVELRFAKDILPYLTALRRNFTMYRLENVSCMRSRYGIRLYEKLVQWDSVGTRTISISWLREIFCLEDRYPLVADLKKRVINPAVKDINEHSDLWVEYDQKKIGRKVTDFVFRFGYKQEKAVTNSHSKQKTPTKYIHGVSVAEIERLAKPGESYEDAAHRIKAQRRPNA
ncbi:replication initiation protein [Halorhodospira halochloris]|uniref:replication initiation protein n=1 Tax=Halorhodospira halochloris TaxID=1052 RepID=UPI001EE8130A|nr:replication initiation protein [Halorhodospira halochloris]MCG5549178.1 replication initiation protein [Halorhodospira halochloris]